MFSKDNCHLFMKNCIQYVCCCQLVYLLTYSTMSASDSIHSALGQSSFAMYYKSVESVCFSNSHSSYNKCGLLPHATLTVKHEIFACIYFFANLLHSQN